MEKRTSGLLLVDPETIASRQEIVNLMAEICGVPAGLIMRITGEDIAVFVRSRTEGNPYDVGDREHLLGFGLHCEHVIETREPLHVPDALSDPPWDSNSDIKLSMIAYHGYPILTPDGGVFGTISVLDRKPRELESQYDCLIGSFKRQIENDLAMTWRAQELDRQNRELGRP